LKLKSEILIIDSHKSSNSSMNQTNLHWINAKILADYLNADLIWSYPNVNDKIRNSYKIIIFVHASAYGYVDEKWLEKNPNAKIFYITNEYNLGEPLSLYHYIKNIDKKYDVISNYVEDTPTRIVKKYVNKFHFVNLNSLVYCRKNINKSKLNSFFNVDKHNIIYYGSTRKGRINSFKKYLNRIVISTHRKNINEFRKYSNNCEFINRINWNTNGLNNVKMSLYLEDDITREYYNNLANRFYEALNYGVTPLFDIDCKKNVKKSNFNIDNKFFISSSDEYKEKIKEYDNGLLKIPEEWYDVAYTEKNETLLKIKNIIFNG